ncbi:nuclear transport factor 2 family protein [Rhabdothermincola salaria]|uniref:nuclear transport factor 2 family protein n=1 Tax=Rhabdothermincola salaria TaxID=2903142 RepID=UPI001E562726|nr:nuclear transport factor 2 family protein [Rhabdothermincola salaria]MCD9624004.1 nuclear transport factor 2 family protein [Rhabdothermincola salaria]
MDLDELLAREEIRDVVKRLARGTDRLDEELMASSYHPDGYDDHNSFRGTGTEFARWVVEVLPHFAATHHFIGDPHFRSIEGDVAQVDTYCIAHHLSRPDDDGRATDMILALRYVDRFERRDGSWRIAHRVCAFDWTYEVPFDAGARFVFEDDFTVGARDRTDITYRDLERRPD